MSTAPIAQGPVDVNVRPVAWLHDQPGRYDVVHDEAKAFWLKAWPKQVEHYTIPLYRHVERQQLSTDAACALLTDALENLMDMMELPPDKNCSCFISPPCNECVEYSGVREAIEIATEALATVKEGK